MNATFRGASACSCGAPSRTARSWSTIAGSGAYSTCTSAAASPAANWLSATTTATPSPTYRTTSVASAGCGGVLRSDPGISHAVGIGLILPARSFPVKTATTPGRARAAFVWTRTTFAWACGLRTITA